MRPPTRINLRTHNPHNPKLLLPGAQQTPIRKQILDTSSFELFLPPKLNFHRHPARNVLVHPRLDGLFPLGPDAAAELAGCAIGEVRGFELVEVGDGGLDEVADCGAEDVACCVEAGVEEAFFGVDGLEDGR